MKGLKIIAVILAVLPAQFFSLKAQTGKIEGKVTDNASGEALIGATVFVSGANKGAIADLDGHFLIEKIPAGQYDVVVNYVGYVKKNIPGVKVADKEVSHLNVTLESEQLKEVVITGEMKKTSVSAIYSMQKNASTISTGISAETIRKTPDKTTGDVVKRLSGASIQDNKFAIIRGLNDRYNNAMMNNAAMPSTEPERRSFQLDLIPSAMLDNIIVIKTATPDLPGDFAGGIIQLNTKDVPDNRFINLSAGTGYNSLTTFRNFQNFQPGKWDAFGLPGSSRSLPSDFPSAKDFTNLSNEQRWNLAKEFPNNWTLYNHSAQPSKSLQFAFGNGYRVGEKDRFGVILSVNYSNSQKFTEVNRNWFSGRGSQEFKYLDSQFTRSTAFGALLNLGYKIGQNTKLSLKNSFNNISDDQTIHRTGQDLINGFDKNSYASNFTRNALYVSQFNAEHFLGKKAKLNYNLTYGHTLKDIPDYRNITYTRPLGDENVPYTLVIGPTVTQAGGSKFYSQLTENLYGGGLNLTVPIFTHGHNPEVNHSLKTGAYFEARQRNYDARVLGYSVNSLFYFDPAFLSYGMDSVFDQKNFRKDGFTVQDITNPSHHYDASSKLEAAYIMLENKIDRFRFIWGVRFESYHQKMNSGNSTGLEQIKVDTVYRDFLPSANIVYALTDKSNFRIAASKTVTRPEFRELAPLTFYDFNTFSMVQGNSSLVRTRIYNFDVRYEIYPADGETFSVSCFYKKFINPIELALDPGLSPGNISRMYINTPSAVNYGVEFEGRQSLKQISDKLKNLVFYGNLSLIYSQVKFSNNTEVFDSKRPLQGQSPYLVNAGIEYNIPKYNATISGYYNRFGSRIYNVGTTNFADIYEKGRSVFDLQASARLLKKKLEVKISVADFLHQQQLFFQDNNKDGKFNSANDKIMFDYRTPTIYSLGLSYLF